MSSVPPNSKSVAATAATTPVAVDDGFDDDEPFGWNVIRPAGLGRFVMLWLLSRNFRLLLAAVPFLLVAVGGSTFLWWLRRAPQDHQVLRHEVAIAESVENEQYDYALQLMQGLINLRPNNHRYRYNRAMLLLQTGATAAGVEAMAELADTERRGYAPARLWLVQQSMAAEPLKTLTDTERLKQLRLASLETPDDINVHRMLASFYVSQNQLRLAEAHLSETVAAHPELALSLAQIQQQVGRDPGVVAASFQTAEEFYAKKLRDDPADETTRAAWARSLMIAGKLREAEALLKEGMRGDHGSELKIALSEVYTRHAATGLAQPGGNYSAVVRTVIQALNLNPENGQALAYLFLLSDNGITCDKAALTPVVDAYRKRQSESEEPSRENTIRLAGLLRVIGEPEEAIRCLTPLVDEEPQLRTVLAVLYRQAGQKGQADQIFQAVLSDTQQSLQESPQDTTAATNYGNALAAAEKLAEAVGVFETYLATAETPLGQQPASFRQGYAIACLGLYDQRHANDPDGDHLDLLTTALNCGVEGSSILQRLTTASFSDDVHAARAEQILNQLAATGKQSFAVYRLMGAAAVEAGKPGRAMRYLERARAVQPENAEILNNLAVAMVRDSTTNAERALELVNQALTLVPGHSEMLVSRAEIYVALERWKDASHDLNVALNDLPNSVDVHRLLVKAYTGLDEPKLAAEHQRVLGTLEKSGE